MTTLDHVQETISEIKTRQRRIAELGGKVDQWWDADYPTQMAIGVFENYAAFLREQQGKLEGAALQAAGTYAECS